MGGASGRVFNEFEAAFPWMTIVILLFGIKFPLATFVGVVLLLFRQISYGLELARNQFPFKFIIYYIPAVFLYAGVLVASYRELFARQSCVEGQGISGRLAERIRQKLSERKIKWST